MTQQALQNQSAEAAQNASPELSLTGQFSGFALKKDGDNNFTVDVSALNGANLTVVANGDVWVKKPPAALPAAPGLILSSPTAKAFDPANAMITVGLVQLNKVSRYLRNLPNEARAEYLISPKSTATLLGRGLGTWNKDTARIRSIDASHGLHFNGQALTGMQIFDRPSDARSVPYEKAWADKVRADWEKARTTRADVVTNLAIMPKELITGRKDWFPDWFSRVTVANNMYSRVGDINAAIAGQGGELIITQLGYGHARWQFTATEHPDNCVGVYSVSRTDGDGSMDGDVWSHKDQAYSSSRAGALRVLAPNF